MTRFAFGANWRRFLETVDEERVAEAERSLVELFELDDLRGLRMLDIGCGSGLFSLAARRLGAVVHGFDYDPQSVACSEELRRRWRPDDSDWTIEQGSALDESYLQGLGEFDLVYSWGVLHHTGDMDRALRLAAIPVRPGGRLAIAIYNDQGWLSRAWTRVKRLYCSGTPGRWLVQAVFLPWFAVRSVLVGLARHGTPWGHFAEYKRRRGMSVYHDWIDWLGGYPFEVATPEHIFRLYRDLGFTLTNLVTTNRLGCNQFTLRRGVGGGE